MEENRNNSRGRRIHNHEIKSLNKAFITRITLNLIFVVAEFGAGFRYNSSGLLPDAGYNLSNVAGAPHWSLK